MAKLSKIIEQPVYFIDVHKFDENNRYIKGTRRRIYDTKESRQFIFDIIKKRYRNYLFENINKDEQKITTSYRIQIQSFSVQRGQKKGDSISLYKCPLSLKEITEQIERIVYNL